MAKNNFLLLFLLSFLLLVSLCATFTAASTDLGGWTPIKNLTDPHLTELGGFAVAQHNKVADDMLKFDKVVNGDQQVVNGMNYRLVLDVKDADEKHVKYRAVVWEKAGSGSKQLTSFDQA